MAPDNAEAISPGDTVDRIMKSVNGRGSTIWVMGTNTIGTGSSRRLEYFESGTSPTISNTSEVDGPVWPRNR